MNIKRLLAAAAVLLAFGAYTMLVVVRFGYFGFVTLSLREPWAMQMLLDLVIALGFASTFVVRDAKKHGLAAWPWIALSIPLGSVSLLSYLVFREVRKASGRASDRSAALVSQP
ncbi:MAG: DUF2834 domain-containing protein [Polyangiaceae bacterium]|nr:DUF2834 domain-containing protein [Polyangiaceae bacterium]